jgi:hypothetical protein
MGVMSGGGDGDPSDGIGAEGGASVEPAVVSVPAAAASDPLRTSGGRAAQDRDGLIEVVLLDHGVRPDRRHQLVLADDAVAVLEQKDQDVVGPRGQVEVGAPRPGELAAQQVDTELSKPIGARGGSVHERLRLFQNVSASFKTFGEPIVSLRIMRSALNTECSRTGGSRRSPCR